MLKGKFVVLSIAAAALLCLQVAGVDTVNSGIVSKCNSTASSLGTYPGDPNDVALACPKGDVPVNLAALGLTISVTVKDNSGGGGAPIAGVPAGDIWVKGCNDALVLCGGSGALNAAAATDALGQTTITGDMAAGGCDTGLNVVVQGVVLGGGSCPAICLGIAVRSADFTSAGAGPADNKIDIHDFSNLTKGFAPKYPSPPKPYAGNQCYDLQTPFGTITVVDFSKFGEHYNHQC
jgi:hypothetical protein